MHAPADRSPDRLPSRRRLVGAVALALLAGLVCSTSTFVSIQRQRVKLIERATPPTDGFVNVTSDALLPLTSLDQPLALIARIRNSDSVAREITLYAEGQPVCRASVAPATTTRIDCQAAPWVFPLARTVRVSGPYAGWSLEYLEVATHHGNTDGLFYFVFLPSRSTLGQLPALAAVVTLSLSVLLLVLLVPAAPMGQWFRRAYLSLAALVVFVWLLCLTVAMYSVVMSFGTLIRLIAILCLPQLIMLWRRLASPLPVGGRAALVRPAIVAVAVALGFALVMRAQLVERFDSNYSGFLLISRAFFDQNPLMRGRDDVRGSLRLVDGGGYDGQFAYYSAFDPLMRAFKDDPIHYRSVVDAVPYRYGRIGFSWLVRLCSLGRWPLYPATMLWLIVAATLVAALALAMMAQNAGMSPMLGALVVFVPGFWQSLQDGLPEPVAAAFLILGCLSASRNRWTFAAVCFACSLLVRETGVVLVVCLTAASALSGERNRAIRCAAMAIAPMMLWRLYVGWILWPDWGLQGFLDHPADLGWPFAGFVDLWRVIGEGQYYGGSAEFARAGVFFPLLLIAGLLLATTLAVRAPSALNIAAVVYAGIGVCLNYPMIWVHVGNGQRGTYELFVVLALSLLAYRTYSRPLRYALTLFWIAAAGYVLFGAFDAEALRLAAGLPI